MGILQPGYLPWLGCFEQIARTDAFVLYDDVQFAKGSWVNRNRIKSAHGAQWLTVPVQGEGHGTTLIRDLRICNHVPWRRKHLRSLEQNYRKAPFFDRYGEDLIAILRRPWTFLLDLNLALIRLLCRDLAIHTPLRLASDLDVGGDRIERLIGIIHALGGDHFYEGRSGADYINVRDFERAGITVTFQDYDHPTYPQLYGAFISHLSVVDLLFNCGPDSRCILTGEGT